jgi:hypothetical protein
MKKLAVCIYISLVVLLLASCQKGLSFPPDTTVNTDTLLKKIILVDSLTPMENIYNIDLEYDDQQRVTTIKRYNVDSSNGIALISLGDSTVFYYQGNDRLPYKSKGYSVLVQSSEVETFHRYQVTGGSTLLAADSVPLNDGISYAARFFSYSNRIVARSEYWITRILTAGFNDTFALSGRDIVKASFFFTPNTGALYFEDMFDTKINPLFKLNIAPVLAVDGESAYDKWAILSPGFCPHNIINRRSSNVYPLSNAENQSYTFTYNKYDQPVQCRLESNSNTLQREYLKFWYDSK